MKKAILFFFLLPSSVFAQNAGPVALDGLPREVSGVVNADTITVQASNNRSYCCSVLRTGGISSTVEFTAFSNFGTIVPIARGTDLPAVRNANNRFCWIDTLSSSQYTGSRNLLLGNITTSVSAQIWCEETSLYGNYNTSVSDFNFLEITARTSISSTINFKVRLKSAVTGQILNTDFTLTLDSSTGDTIRRDVSIHDLLGNTADFGDVRITHDGAPGQVSARISQYDITSTNPLNFTLVGQEKFQRGTYHQ